MKLFIVVRFESWIKTHISHFASAFEQNGHTVKIVDYEKLDNGLIPKILGKAYSKKTRHQNLEKHINKERPDAILFCISDIIFDFDFIKSFYKGLILVYDWDGPNWSPYKDLSWVKSIDFIFTVSKLSQRQLKQKNIDSFYLPHGVDSNFYSHKIINDSEHNKYYSTVSFVGRPTQRRNEYLSEITDYGLKLWGRRWHDKVKCPKDKLQKCNSYDKDIFEEEVVKVYNASDLYVNILREPLDKPPTILSLQTFAVPSCGTCLIQEWVEELDKAFEDRKEILSFKTKEEFVQLIKKYSKDRNTARNIGIAGRERILAQHTHIHRAKELIKMITNS